nr:MAG TPA: hypothetical protein [Caudoviricetes sp.]
MSDFSRLKRNETLSTGKSVIDKVGTFKVLSKNLGVILADAEVHEIVLKEQINNRLDYIETRLINLETKAREAENNE